MEGCRGGRVGETVLVSFVGYMPVARWRSQSPTIVSCSRKTIDKVHVERRVSGTGSCVNDVRIIQDGLQYVDLKVSTNNSSTEAGR